MAARRLIVVLVLLLAASILAASIAPNRSGRLVGVENTTTSAEEETTSTEPAAEPTGIAVHARIEASAERPQTAYGLVGDQLALTVGANPPRTVEIAAFGLTEFAGDDAPARFDLLLREPGTYPITDAEQPDVTLGRLVVRARPGPGDGEA